VVGDAVSTRGFGLRPIWERTAVTFDRPIELALVAAAVVVLTAASLFVLRSIRGS